MAATIDLKKATENELKAFAYDCIAAIEANQNSLKMVNDELTLRQKNVDPKPATTG